ncbi:DNA helicase [Coprinopsis cinerea okayama7|uniref:DNA helicase n=1 Tax=Coprinopsis cinerea (strain Okayama-7 / 130 / ATCC MYA-4618 / FGSC 9003) TaxID=240176 RepID=A8N8C4_COPC7|nr:DNA helicase [Coprinopsis cinerea okayama7\|eukprot:XP_001831080.2 DNA helicase [Coprinopsis cinerea okayama7\
MFVARQGAVTCRTIPPPGPTSSARKRRSISSSQIPRHVSHSLSHLRIFSSQSVRQNYGRQHSHHRYHPTPKTSPPKLKPSWKGTTSSTTGDFNIGNFSSTDQEESLFAPSNQSPPPQSPHSGVKDKAKALSSDHWSPRATSRMRQTQRKRCTAVREAMKGETRFNPVISEGLKGKDTFFEQIEAYKSRFIPAIRAEQLRHEAVLRERQSGKTLEQLKAEGYCIDDMQGFWSGSLELGKHVATFSLGPGIKLPEGHQFERGNQVLLSRVCPLTAADIIYKGTVMSVGEMKFKIYFDEEHQHRFTLTAPDGITPLRWRLDLGSNNIVFERMEAAIRSLWHDPKRYYYQNVCEGTHLRDILLKSFTPEADPMPVSDDPNSTIEQTPEDPTEKHPGEGGRGGGAFSDDTRIQSWVSRYSLPVPLVSEGDMPIHNLNSSQIRAMASMIGNRLSLVQGPPGTGKTKTIIETLKLLKLHFRVPHRILVCTYTNVAVDNLVEGLAAAGVKPLRVGAVGSVRPSLLHHTLAAKLESHPLYSTHQYLVDQLEVVKKKIAELTEKVHLAQKELKDKEGNARYVLARRVENMEDAKSDLVNSEKMVKSKKKRVRQAMLRDVTSEADVLPPIVVSPEAQKLGLGVSLFERLTKEGVVPSVMLDTQYRMHPNISYFPSNEFYLGTVRDGTVDEQGRVSKHLSPPMSQYLDLDLSLERLSPFQSGCQYKEGQGADESKPRPSVIFLHHSGEETMKDKSRINRTEARIIADVVMDLLRSNPDLQGKDIGIIAPYVAQISLLTRIFNSPPDSAPSSSSYGSKFCSALGHDLTVQQLSQIEIKTVDGFEGREKDVIIFSTVRNNPEGNIGFLADPRRLNVGLTRAKRALFVVGNIATLKMGKVSGGRFGTTTDIAGGEVVVADNGQGAVRVEKGAESWRRYAQYLLERGLVVHVEKNY